MNAVKIKDGLNLMRLTCACTLPSHVVDFIVDDEMKDRLIIEVNMSDKQPFFTRVKNAFLYILGKEVCAADVYLEKDDVFELIGFLGDMGYAE